MTLTSRIFAAQGYSLHADVVPEALCAALRQEVLETLRKARWSPWYHLNRLGLGTLTPIRKPWRRHCVILPVTTDLRRALNHIAFPLQDAGLPLNSELVELTAFVSYPGSYSQTIHTDISPCTSDVEVHTQPCHRDSSLQNPSKVAPLVIAWLALQSVTSEMGPTTVIPGSHIRHAQRSARIAREAAAEAEKTQRRTIGTYEYKEDGTLIPHDDFDGVTTPLMSPEEMHDAENRKAAALAADEARELAQFGPEPAPHELLLDKGSVALMDSRILHFGAGHASSSSSGARVILGGTFATAGRGARRMSGFTYHGSDALPFISLGELLEAGSRDE